jgi:DnaJ family protein B protein 12
MFDTGPQVFFGGPGIRVHQFGGARPRGRPREANAAEERPQNFISTLASLLPLLFLFILPLLSSIFSSADTRPSGPHVRFDSPQPPHTLHHKTNNFKFDYYINPADVLEYTASKWKSLDKSVEDLRIRQLRTECNYELEQRRRIVEAAQGWFFQDEGKMQEARNMEMKSCRILEQKRLPLP